MRIFDQYVALAERQMALLHLPTDCFPTLYEPALYALGAGGKRLRPALLLMGAEACGAKAESLLMPAVGIETFHNFTLLHDDVMDKSDLRRGKPTVHIRWDENTAILSGDAMLTLATDWISKVDDSCLRRVLDTFNRTALDVYEGQAKDMEFETRDDVSLDEYIAMITEKTSALLGGAVKIGAQAAGADDVTADALYDYGVNIGLAFQIKDDWLDVFGDSSSFGKPIGGDILNRKKTYLLVSAYASGVKVAAGLDEAFASLSGKELVDSVREIYVEAGIPEICEHAIGLYHAQALQSLDKAEIAADAKEEFRILASRLASRNK